MAKYSASNTLGGTQQAISTAYKTLLSLRAITATLCGGKLYDLLIGTDGAPGDTAYVFDVSRQTADGTATAVTPTLLDPTSRAAGSQADANYTAEGTITAASSLWSMGINQRASYRWLAAPDSELVWPATNDAGLAIRAKSPTGTVTAIATALFEE